MSLFSCYFVLYFNHFLSYPPEIDGQLYLDFLIEKFGENKISEQSQYQIGGLLFSFILDTAWGHKFQRNKNSWSFSGASLIIHVWTLSELTVIKLSQDFVGFF